MRHGHPGQDLATAAPGEEGSITSFWYVKDGQVFLPARLDDPFFQVLDSEDIKVGGTRIPDDGGKPKLLTRLMGKLRGINEGGQWSYTYIRYTCQCPPETERPGVLGVSSRKLAKQRSIGMELHSKIRAANELGVELTLLRRTTEK